MASGSKCAGKAVALIVVVETFFKTVKSELVRRTIFRTRAEAKEAIGRYIASFYNLVRRHSTLDYVSPLQFEELAG